MPFARRRLELDPLHEPAHRELICLLSWSGDRAAAMEQYRVCVRALSEELGVSPLTETTALFEQVYDGTLPEPGRLTNAEAPVLTPVVADPPGELPLVSRAAEIAALLGAHEGARPDGVMAVIEGEAGIGKTRLADELVRRTDGVVLSAHCHDDEAGIPYGPVVELLREAVQEQRRRDWARTVPDSSLVDAALLLPELAQLRPDLPPPLPLDGPGGPVRLMEGIAAVISAACTGPSPGIVILDDAHAADEATLDAISYLARRLQGRSMLVVVCWRSEAMPPGHRLRGLAVDLEATIVSPARLDEDEVAQLVRTTRSDGESTDLARRVFLESEGLPLFVAEYLATLAEGGTEDAPLAKEMRGLLDRRLSGLGEAARQVLGAAAAVGRSFDFETVRQVSGRSDEEAVSALENLIVRGVVRETQGAELVYDFSHSKLRELVYEGTGLARRRLLHKRIAAAIGSQRRGVASAGLLATHLRLAGDIEGAAQQHRIAAEHAIVVHAHADALEHLEAALAWESLDAGDIHERMGDVRVLLGDYAGALASYRTASAYGRPESQAAIEHKAGSVHHRRGEWDRAESRFTAALDAAPPAATGLRARIMADLGLTLHQSGQPGRATQLAYEALELAEAADDLQAEAQAHNILGVFARSRGEAVDALDHLGRSLEIAQHLGDGPAEGAALNNLALVHRDDGELDAALELSERALTLCADYGDRHREAALENNLADLHHAAGHEDEAMAHLKRAVALFSEVGADEATRLPEIWKLVSW